MPLSSKARLLITAAIAMVIGGVLIGAIVLAGLAGVFTNKIEDNPKISDQIASKVSISVESGLDFVSADQIGEAARAAGIDDQTSQALTDDYQASQLQSLKAGLLAAAFLALISLASTRDLPRRIPGKGQEPSTGPPAEDLASA